MKEQYFGAQELYQIVLKANNTMQIGNRIITPGEPVAYFDNIKMSNFNQSARPIMARGGWGNTPHVVWENRNEMEFTMSEGVITHLGMSILFNTPMKEKEGIDDTVLVPYREGPFLLDDEGKYRMKHIPYTNPDKRLFCFEYENNAIQKYVNDFDFEIVDKDIGKGIKKQYSYLKVKNPDQSKQYVLDYYFKYGDDYLLYIVDKERLKGTFSLEAKFYTKDENEGENVTNIITLPKVKVISNINLRLGEKANPMTSEFNIIAMPVRTQESDNLIMKVIRLNEDIDND